MDDGAPPSLGPGLLVSPLPRNSGPLCAAKQLSLMAVICACELVLDRGRVGWPLRRQAQRQLPLILESCGGSVPGNYKLVTDLICDLNSILKADSQRLLTRGSGISVRIEQETAGSWEPGSSRNGGTGSHVCECECVCVSVFILMCPGDAAVCAAVCLSKAPLSSD